MQYVSASSTQKAYTELNAGIKSATIEKQQLLDLLDTAIVQLQNHFIPLPQPLDESIAFISLFITDEDLALRFFYLYLVHFEGLAQPHIVANCANVLSIKMKSNNLSPFEQQIVNEIQEMITTMTQFTVESVEQLVFQTALSSNKIEFESKLDLSEINVNSNQGEVVYQQSLLSNAILVLVFNSFKLDIQRKDKYVDFTTILTNLMKNKFSFNLQLKFTGIQLEDLSTADCGSKKALDTKLNSVVMARTQMFTNKKLMLKAAADLGFKGEKFDLDKHKDLIPVENTNLNRKEGESDAEYNIRLAKRRLPAFAQPFAGLCRFTRISPDWMWKNQVNVEDMLQYFGANSVNFTQLFTSLMEHVIDDHKPLLLINGIYCVIEAAKMINQQLNDIQVFEAAENMVCQISDCFKSVVVTLVHQKLVDDAFIQLSQLFSTTEFRRVTVLAVSTGCLTANLQLFTSPYIVESLLVKMRTRFDPQVYKTVIQHIIEYNQQPELTWEAQLILQNSFNDLSFEQLYNSLVRPLSSGMLSETDIGPNTCVKMANKLHIYLSLVLQFVHTRTVNAFSFYEENSLVGQYKEHILFLIEQCNKIECVRQQMNNLYEKQQNHEKKQQMQQQLTELNEKLTSFEIVQITAQNLGLQDKKKLLGTFNHDEINLKYLEEQLKNTNCIEDPQQLITVAQSCTMIQAACDQNLTRVLEKVLDPDYVFLSKTELQKVSKIKDHISASIILAKYKSKYVSELIQKIQSWDDRLPLLLLLLDGISCTNIIDIVQRNSKHIQTSVLIKLRANNCIKQVDFDARETSVEIIRLKSTEEQLMQLASYFEQIKEKNNIIELTNAIVLLLQIYGSTKIGLDLLSKYLKHFQIMSYDQSIDEKTIQKQLINLVKVAQSTFHVLYFNPMTQQQLIESIKVLKMIATLTRYKDEVLNSFYNQLFRQLTEGISISLSKHRSIAIMQILSTVLTRNAKPHICAELLFKALKHSEKLKFIGLFDIGDDAKETVLRWIE